MLTAPPDAPMSDARSDDWLRRYPELSNDAERDVDNWSHGQPPTPCSLRGPTGSAPPGVGGSLPGRERENLPMDQVSAVLEANGIPHDVVAREMTRASDDPYMQAASRDDGRFRKATSLLNVLGELHKTTSGASSVDVRSRLPPGEFRDRYYAANRPVILQDLA